ncbi:plasmid related protein [Paraburkholderia heleia]|uniref:plasmid related protein n=1 Tax=Paraburkholderia heleia TaxID=634127 RepID=UPI002AB73EED|nr:plasmid related protein [Paraburkholderia heleia]
MKAAGINPCELLGRHQRGDWGTLDAHDCAANDYAVAQGARILSAYEVGTAQEKVWIITEADRSVTTVLLPGEY